MIKCLKRQHHEVITILESIELHQLDNDSALIFNYLDILSISLYYINPGKGKIIAEQLLNLATKNKDILKLLQQHKDRIIGNYTFYGLKDRVESII